MIPEAAVEAAAKAEYEHEFLMLEGTWEKVPNEVKALFRESAKVALEAAAPHLLAGLKSELVTLAKDFDAAIGGSLAYTATDGRFQMRKNAHDQLMYIVGDADERRKPMSPLLIGSETV